MCKVSTNNYGKTTDECVCGVCVCVMCGCACICALSVCVLMPRRQSLAIDTYRILIEN